MAPAPEIRVWRPIIRVTWATAALAGVVVAFVPSVRLATVVAATLFAGIGALAFMLWRANRRGWSLRRPKRVNLPAKANAIVVAAAGLIGALAGLSFVLVRILDAPYGLVIPMAAACGGIGAEILDRIGLRLEAHPRRALREAGG